jgi:hypothetical protein
VSHAEQFKAFPEKRFTRIDDLNPFVASKARRIFNGRGIKVISFKSFLAIVM